MGHTQGNAIFGGIYGPKRTTVTGEAITTAIIVARIIGPVANWIILNRIISAVVTRVAFSPGADFLGRGFLGHRGCRRSPHPTVRPCGRR